MMNSVRYSAKLALVKEGGDTLTTVKFEMLDCLLIFVSHHILYPSLREDLPWLIFAPSVRHCCLSLDTMLFTELDIVLIVILRAVNIVRPWMTGSK